MQPLWEHSLPRIPSLSYTLPPLTIIIELLTPDSPIVKFCTSLKIEPGSVTNILLPLPVALTPTITPSTRLITLPPLLITRLLPAPDQPTNILLPLLQTELVSVTRTRLLLLLEACPTVASLSTSTPPFSINNASAKRTDPTV